MTDKLTSQQKMFVKGIAQGKNYRGAARYAGYMSPDYGSVLMKQDNIRTALQAYMHKAGITDEVIARKLRDGLNARTVPKSEGGQRYDDQFVRKQFLDVILRIRGDYAPEKFESVNKQITLVMDNKMLAALQDSKALDAEEVQYLEHTPIKESIDGELDTGGDKAPRSTEEIIRCQEGGDNTLGGIIVGSEEEGDNGEKGKAGPDIEEIAWGQAQESQEREGGSLQEGIDGEGQAVLGEVNGTGNV